MKQNDLLKELHRIVEEYIPDESCRVELKKDIHKAKVKYILGEIEKKRKKEFTEADSKVIKDLFFYFC